MGQDKAASPAASSRYQRAVEVFLGACEVAPDLRDAFVREACADDGELLASARALLTQDETSDESIDGAAASAAALLGEEEAPLPERIGAYRVLRVIGEGGMGTVYEAEQETPRRRVALKVVRAAMATPRVCRRFELEAEVLGRLEHPGIARIYEAGSTDMPWGTVPFLAMELVRGRPLDEHAEHAKLDLRERVALLARVCDAVDHAHQHGIVHRDLKPQNVLVDEQGDPKVLDFGIAWLAESERGSRTVLTLEGQLIGTLAYMSPEQVRGERAATGAQADVYALGAIGYEVLARRLPLALEGRPLAESARIVADVDPPPLSLHEPACAGDLDVIFGKALEKDPGRRYSSAAELAAELRRFLAEEPIVARPPSRAYQLRKFARRNRALVGGVAIAFVALLVGTTLAIWKAMEASEARDVSESRTRDARRSAYRANIAAALTALRAHNVREAAARLDDAPESLRGWEWRHLSARLDESVAVFAAGTAPLSAVALDPEPRFLATGSEDGTVTLWDWATSAPIAKRREKGRKILDLRFEREGSTLRVASVSGYPEFIPHVANVALPSLDVLATWNTPGRGSELRFADDSPRIAQMVWGRGLLVFEPESGRIEVECEAPDRAVRAILSADGRRAGVVAKLASGFEILDLERRTSLLRRDLSGVNGLQFNADASQLLVTLNSPAARVVDVTTGNERLHLAGHEAAVLDARFSADERSILTASADGTLRVFETAFGSCVRTLHGHRGSIQRIATSPDGRSIVTAGSDGMARRWDVASGDDGVLPHPAAVYPVAYSPDGRRIATGCLQTGGPGLHIWDAESGDLVAAWIDHEVTSLCWSRDGKQLAVGIHNRRALVLDADTGAILASSAYHLWNTDSIEFDPRGVELLSAGLDGKLVVSSVKSQKSIWSTKLGPPGAEPIYRAAFSRDGTRIVASRADGSLVVLDAASREEKAVFRGHAAPVVALTFSTDGKRLASGSRNGEILVWSFPDGALANRLVGHVNEVFALAFTPDGSRLVSGGRDRTLRIWEVESGEEIAQLGGHTSFLYDFDFSPDGHTLVSAGGDSVARLWDTRSAAERFDARRERARIAGAVAATVDQVLAEHLEPRSAVEALRSAPFSSEREREVALQLALARLVERGRAR